jgi:Low psii accumulation1 / Rep27
MVDHSKGNAKTARSQLSPEKYARLRAEAKAPYRGLRKFVYLSFGASGLIGAMIFLTQLAAGREVASALPNFALQLGVVALMVWLFRWENRAERKDL